MGSAIERRVAGAAGRRPRWRAQPASLILGCLTAVVLGFVLPATAPAATTAKLSPAFTATKAGTALRLGYTLSEPAGGGVPAAPTQAIVHLPKGTGINLGVVPKSQLCNFGTLVTLANGPKACPKGSHAGPTGSIEFEAAIGGKPTTSKGSLKPFLVELADGSRALALYAEVAPPFFDGPAVTIRPYKGNQLIVDIEAPDLSPSVRVSTVSLSATIGQNAKITPPKSCPKGGYAWSASFSYLESPDTTAKAISPCLAKSKAKAARSGRAAAAARPKTQSGCETKFHTSKGRASCFNQLPGANCQHPLEVQKTYPNYRGDTKYFTVNFSEEPNGATEVKDYGVIQHWSWKPKPNVAICPYPNGAVYKVSLQNRQLPNGMFEEVVGYKEKNIPEKTTAHGGHFTYSMLAEPTMSWYLRIWGYFIHPAWEGAAG